MDMTSPDHDALKGMLQSLEHMLNTLDAVNVAANQLIAAQKSGKPLSERTLHAAVRKADRAAHAVSGGDCPLVGDVGRTLAVVGRSRGMTLYHGGNLHDLNDEGIKRLWASEDFDYAAAFAQLHEGHVWALELKLTKNEVLDLTACGFDVNGKSRPHALQVSLAEKHHPPPQGHG
jgi:hypothetical protein